MRYNELFKKIKNLKVDEFGFTKEVLGFKLHIYSHKHQLNIIRGDEPRVVITNYNQGEVKIYIANDGYVDYDNPNKISSADDEVNEIIMPVIALF